jgi:hypothetical protein
MNYRENAYQEEIEFDPRQKERQRIWMERERRWTTQWVGREHAFWPKTTVFVDGKKDQRLTAQRNKELYKEHKKFKQRMEETKR